MALIEITKEGQERLVTLSEGLDYLILREIESDGPMDYTAVTANVSAPTSTIKHRIETLIQRGEVDLIHEPETLEEAAEEGIL